jgi:hypothetical protein
MLAPMSSAPVSERPTPSTAGGASPSRGRTSTSGGARSKSPGGLRSLVAATSFTVPVVTIAMLVGVSSSASGDNSKVVPRPTENAAADDGGRYDPDNITAISESMETLLKGNARYGAKDFPGAIDLYKRAIQLNPRSALGPYLLGEGYLAMNNLGEAEAAFKQAQEISDTRNPALRSRVLFAVADVFERQKKFADAKTAWQAYNEHASKLGADGGAFPASGAERLRVVEAILKLDKDYELVRQRIAAEKADAGAAAAPKK